MSKTEILQQSAAVSNERRVERLANQIEMLRQADRQSVEELAETLEPLAQAMAEIDRKSREQVETFNQQIENSAKAWNNAAAEVKQAANSLNKAGERME